MQEHTIPVGNLVFPILLPLRERRLLQQTVCLDDELGGCSLETYTALDANDSITHVGITTNGIRSTNLLNFLDGLDVVVELLTIHSHNLTLLELNLQQ